MLKIITLIVVLLGSSVFAQDKLEVEATEVVSDLDKKIEQVNAINDEGLRELVKIELAKKIAQDIHSDSTSSSTQIVSATKVSSEEVIQPKTISSHKGIHANIGIIARTSSVELASDSYAILYGPELNFSAIKSVAGAHKFRLGVSFTSVKSDSIKNGDTLYEFDDLAYKGIGTNLSYSYMLNSIFGIGAFYNYNFGELEYCLTTTCQTYDASMMDLGFRFDLLISHWNPYLAIGYSYAKYDKADFNGASVFIGLLNLEF